MKTWRQRATFVAIALFVGGAVAGMLLDETAGPWESLAWTVGAVGMAAVFVVSRAARRDLADDLPDFVHRIWRLRWPTVAGTAVLGAVLLVGGYVLHQHAADRVEVADHIASAYAPAGTERLRDGGGASARVYADPDRLPLLAAAHLRDTLPAEDERYTPAGILLRYDRSVVAVLPDGRRGSRLLVMEPQAAFRHLHAYVGGFWDAAVYQRSAGVVTSALARPADGDLRRLRRWLDAAERRHGVCYGWRVRITSGRARGPVDDPRDPPAETCRRHVVLTGTIDPREGRYTERGTPGDWELGYEARLGGAIPEEAIDAVEVGHGELIRGATTWPNADGSHLGKGLLEQIGALPLLAMEAESRLRPIPLVPPGAVPAGARIAPAERGDGERDAQRTPLGIAGALMAVAGLVLLAAVVLLVPAALARRAIRRRWPGRLRPRERGRRRHRSSAA